MIENESNPEQGQQPNKLHNILEAMRKEFPGLSKSEFITYAQQLQNKLEAEKDAIKTELSRIQSESQLILSDLRALQQNQGWEKNIDREHRALVLKPVVSEGVRTEDGKTFIDTTIEQNKYDSTVPSVDGVLHRGITEGELQAILDNGFIQSEGDRVEHIGGDERQTFFTNDISEAVRYGEKPGRIPAARQPGFGRANYVISLSADFASQYHVDSDSSEVGIPGKIPAEAITDIIEMRPIEITMGIIPLQILDGEVSMNDSIAANWQYAPQVQYVYRKISIPQHTVT